MLLGTVQGINSCKGILIWTIFLLSFIFALTFCSILPTQHSTHYAGYQGAIAARNILLPFSDPGVLEDVPATTFTDPEVRYPLSHVLGI